MPNVCSNLTCDNANKSAEELYKEILYTDEFGCPAILLKSLGPVTQCPALECQPYSLDAILKMVWHSEGMQVVETDNAGPRITDCNDIPSIEQLFSEALAVDEAGNECFALRVFMGLPITSCTDLTCSREELEARLKNAFVIDSNGCTALVIAETDIYDTPYFDCNKEQSVVGLLHRLLVEVASNGILGSGSVIPANGCDQPILQIDSFQCANNGVNDGNVVVSVVSGGNGDYTYMLDGLVIQVNDGTFLNIGAGDHSIAVIDGLGCEGDDIDFNIPECGFLQQTLDFVTQLEFIDDPNEIYFAGEAWEINGAEIWDAFNEAFVVGAATGFTPTAWWPMYGGVVTRHVVEVIDPIAPATQMSIGGMTNTIYGAKGTNSVNETWRLNRTGQALITANSRGTIFLHINDDSVVSPNLVFGAVSSGGGRLIQINATKPAGNVVIGVGGSAASSAGLATVKGIHISSRRTLTNIKYRINKTEAGSSVVNAGAGTADCRLHLFGRHSAACGDANDFFSDSRVQGLIIFDSVMNDAQCDAWVDVIEQLYTRLLTWIP